MKGKAGMFSGRLLPPDAYANLTGWWDASDSSTLYDATTGGSLVAADGAVARLEDKSGNGRHFTQSTLANRPTRRTSVRNSLDVLRFDGANDRMDSTALFSNLFTTTAYTVFVVAKATNVDTNQANSQFANDQVFTCTGAGNGFFVLRTNGTVGAYGYYTAMNQYLASTISYTTGNWTVLSAIQSGNTLTARSNRTDGTGVLVYTQDYLAFAARIGANGNATQFFDGDVGEIVTYNVALSTSDRDAIESYLMSKWGI